MRLPLAILAAALPASALAQSWTAKAGPGAAVTGQELLTDGSVLVQGVNRGTWWKLTPDNQGSYVNGTWSQIASMPAGYAPLYRAAAVLPDGRLIVNGGEYNGTSTGVWTTLGAIYDPATNAWTSVAPPAGWTTIGDAQSIVRPNGTYMLANCCTAQQAILNAKTLTWTAVNTAAKADINDEEGWTLLPGARGILTVDTNDTSDLKHTEIFSKGVWSFAGDTVAELPDLTASGGGSHEMGPQVLRPNGTVFAAGATGHTGIYTIKTGTWSAGPDFPTSSSGQLDVADGPAALEPSGRVIVAASPGVFNKPTSFYEFTGTALNPLPAYTGAAKQPSYTLNFLVLPTGQIMVTDQTGTVQFFTPAGAPNAGSVPHIGSFPATVTRGTSFMISGTLFSGRSQGAAYGDDYQSATNYPLVRVTNTATGHVAYAKTRGFSSLALGNPKTVTAHVVIPTNAETGASTLAVVTNGIASAPVTVIVQ